MRRVAIYRIFVAIVYLCRLLARFLSKEKPIELLCRDLDYDARLYFSNFISLRVVRGSIMREYIARRDFFSVGKLGRRRKFGATLSCELLNTNVRTDPFCVPVRAACSPLPDVPIRWKPSPFSLVVSFDFPRESHAKRLFVALS